MEMKPLFIPVTTKYFELYASGRKDAELRLYGQRWNEKVCKVGRKVIISKGYGKHARLTGEIFCFVKMSGRSLSPENQMAVKDVYGTLDVLIAFIGICDIKNEKHE